MRQVSLRKLTVSNFRSFKGRHEVVFQESGLVLLQGENRDTRGSSGAGKTNLLRALNFVLDFCNISAKHLTCWFADGPMYVEVELDSQDGPVVLRRSPKGYSIRVGAEPAVEGDSKAVKERLDRLCGVDADLRESLTYRDQRKPRRFLSMANSVKKEFLTTVLGLQKLEQEVKDGTKRVTKLAAAVEGAKTNLEAAQTGLEAIEVLVLDDEEVLQDRAAAASLLAGEAAGAVRTAEKELNSVQAEEAADITAAQHDLEVDLHEAQRKLSGVRASIGHFVTTDTAELEVAEDKLRRCDEHVAAARAEDAKAKIAYDQLTQGIRQQAKQLHNELAKVPGLRSDERRLTHEADQLRADTCAMCGRTWANAQQKLAETVVSLEGVRRQIAATESHHARAQELDTALAARTWTPAPVLERLARARTKILEQIATERERLKGAEAAQQAAVHLQVAKAQAVVDRIQANLKTVRAEIISAPDRPAALALQAVLSARETLSARRLHEQEVLGALRVVQERNQGKRAAHAAQQARRRSQEAVAAAASAAREAVEADHHREADVLEVLRGFRNRVFDEVLQEIGQEASEILAGLPNASHISLEFRSQWETDDGKLKDEIEAFTYLHGEERGLDESVSGGQATSVELAVDLAVAKVVGRRHGCRLNWLILDESFTGHDHVTKQACLEVLQQYAQDKLVLVVDHACELRDAFQQVITVVHQDKLSRIEEGAQ